MSDSILDHNLISERYFFPRNGHFDNPFWVDCGEVKLGCYFFRGYPNSKTIVFFHGNGEIVSDYFKHFVPIILEMGYNCFLAEYRGYGMSTGTPALVKMLEDVEQIINATNQAPEELILFGRSVGSYYAIHGASCFPNIGGLIIESGIADTLERLLLRVEPDELNINSEQLEAEVSKYLDHQHKLSDYKGSTLILHTQHDSLVDVSHAHQLYHWSSEPKQLKIFPNGDHNSIFMENANEYFGLVENFIENI